MSYVAAFHIRRPQLKLANAHYEWYVKIQEFSHIVVFEVHLRKTPATDGERKTPEGVRRDNHQHLDNEEPG